VVIIGASAVSGGQAALSTSLLASGPHSFKARYLGDTAYAASVSSPVSQTVTMNPSLGFRAAIDYTIPSYGLSSVPGDFNNDGKIDIAVATVSGIRVFLGNGDGTFQTPLVASTAYVQTMIVADFDGDGHPDIAGISAFSMPTVLLGNGDGTFRIQSISTFLQSSNAALLGSGDFNGDGIPDLVMYGTYSSFGQGLLVEFGDGMGGFRFGRFLGAPQASALAVGDFNGDGKADLAIGVSYVGVSIYLGNGDGTFQIPASATIGQGITHLAIGDLNGDGKPDVVTDSSAGGLNVLLGNGDGTLQAPVHFPPAIMFASPASIAIADVNGDGKPDVVTSEASAGTVSVYIGNGDGSLRTPAPFVETSGPSSVIVVDLNGDGRPDIASVGSTTLSVRIGQASGPDLTVWQSHSGNFTQGQYGAAYTITVSNVGTGATNDAVTMYGTVPSGLTVTSMSGSGWTCILPALSCNRSDPLVVEGSYPPITVLVDVAANAPPSIGPTARVAFGGELNTQNNTHTDLTVIVQRATLALASFANPATAGQSITLTATVTPASATGTVSFLDGTTMIGSATLTSGVATLSTNQLAAGSHSLTAQYAGDAMDLAATSPAVAQIVNLFVAGVDLYITLSHTGSFNPGQTALYTIAVGNAGSVASSGMLTVIASLPAGLSATSSSAVGTGWACTAGSTTTCTRSDSVAAGSSFPVITLTVSVAANAPTVVTTTASVAGGGDTNVANNTASDIAKVRQASNVILLSSASPATFGQPVTLTATLTPASATGKVVFFSGAATWGVATISSGQAKLTTSQLPAGVNQVRARYLGDNGNLPALSAVLPLTVKTVPQDGFLAPTTLFSAGYPTSIAAGDFNEDGKADFAAAAGGAVTIYLGNGNGGFQPIVIPANAGYILNGDFNGDGHQDLAVLYTSSSGANASLTIWLGNGDGTFQFGQPLDLGTTSVVSPAVADWNGDGYLDIAYGDNALGQVSVAFGNGDGSFGKPAGVYTATSSFSWLVAGDFNGDGAADMVLSAGNVPPVTLLGKGDGTFQAVTNPNLLAGYSLVVADMNGDGKLDLVFLTSSGPALALGIGDGTFANTVYAGANSNSYLSAVACGDLDGDGVLDLVDADYYSGKIEVRLGNGDGTFRSPIAFTTGVLGGPLLVGDFNGDGRSDILATGGVQLYSVLLGKQTTPDLTVAVSHTGNFLLGQNGAQYTITVTNAGTAASSGTVTVTDTLPASLTASAMSGAGWSCTLSSLTCTRSDALASKGSYPITLTVNVAVNSPNSVTESVTVSGGGDAVTTNNSATDVTAVLQATSLALTATPTPSTFGQAVTLTAKVTPSGASGKVSFFDSGSWLGTATVSAGQAVLTTTQLAAGGHALLARFIVSAAAETSVSPVVTQTVNVLPQLGFQATTPFAGAGQQFFVAADFDGDGKTDLATLIGNVLSIQLGNGDGTFRAVTVASNVFLSCLVAGDLNGDGKQDLAYCSSTGAFVVLLGNGDGTFRQGVTTAAPGTAYSSAVITDLNSDGIGDLVVGGSSGIGVLMGKGDGTFLPLVSITAFSVPQVLAADFNGDGKPDLAFLTPNLPTLFEVLLSNGDGTFQAPIPYAGTGGLSSAKVGDFNGDGKLDIAAVGSNGLYVFLGNGDGTFQPAKITPVANFSYLVSLAIGDFDGDGKLDVAALLNGANLGSLLVYAGKGDGTFQSPVTAYSQQGVTYSDNTALLAGSFNPYGRTDFVVGSGTFLLLSGRPAAADLTIAKRHIGNFARGQSGAVFYLTVSNIGATPTAGQVTVTDTLPSSLTASAITGTGWNCTLGTVTCTRSDALAVGASYPPITVTTSVAGNAPSSITNTAVVSGGGEVITNNDTASDTVAILQLANVTLATSANPQTLSQPLTFTATVAPTAATGKVTFYDGVTILAIAPLFGGRASMSTTLLSGGAHTIMARYSGDATYNAASATQPQGISAVPQAGLVSPRASGWTPGSFSLMADVNGDGKVDGISVNNTLQISLGNGDGTFNAPANFGAFISPTGLALGDFNGDGKLDFVVSDRFQSQLTIFPGNGDGTVGAALSYSFLPVAPDLIASGDFNSDGKTDLAIFTSDGNLTVWLGNGDGTFQPAIAGPAVTASTRVLVTDLNGDGWADLVTLGPFGNQVNVLFGNGDGTFQPPQTISMSSAFDFAIADYNGDGKMDLAVLLRDGTVSVFLGKGDGTFQAPSTITDVASQLPGGYFTLGLASGDLNGDGKPDLVVSPSVINQGTTVFNTYVLLGRGDGTFQLGGIYHDWGIPIIVDVDRDGRPDLLVGADVWLGTAAAPDLTVSINRAGALTLGQTGSYTITVKNAGNAATTANVSLTISASAGLSLLSISGSGWNCSTGGTCTFAGNQPAGASYPPIGVTAVLAFPPPVVTMTATVAGGGEINTANDSASDVATFGPATALTVTSSPNPSTLGQAVMLTATLTPASASGKVEFTDGGTVLGSAAISGGKATLITRMLPSGKRNLLAAYRGDNAAALQASGGVLQTVNSMPSFGFQPPVGYPTGAGPSFVVTGDFNGDGNVDLAVANATDLNIAVLLGNGDGSFRAPIKTAIGFAAKTIITSDFDGDGRTDLLVDGRILLGNGDGTFRTGGPVGCSQAVGDFNGDGRIDLACGAAGGIGVMLGNGDGTFGPLLVSNLNISGSFLPLAVADFDGDGRLDLATLNAVAFGNGDGTFRLGPNINAVQGASILAGDLNGDGKPDILTFFGGDVETWINDGTGHFTSQNTLVIGGSGAALGDFNGDGRQDMVQGSQPLIFVSLSNADGTFQASQGWAAGTGDYRQVIAVADFNGDGRPDVVVTNITGNGVNVLLGAGPDPDLTVTSSHVTAFTVGQPGTYRLSVTNSGGSATTAPVTVTDTLPTGVTATSVAGDGWSCTLASLSCTRSDALAPDTSFPYVTVAVSVSGSAPASATNNVTVSGGGELNTSNDTFADVTTIFPRTTLALSVVANPPLIGKPVTITATVTPSTTGGKVTFYSGVKILAVQPVVNGTAVFTISLLPVGTSKLWARYSGNGLTGSSALGPCTASPASLTISTLPQTGFLAAVTNPIGAIVATADFNLDGKPDFITTAGYPTPTLTVWLSNGDGTYRQTGTLSLGGGVVAVGDFNGDGIPDVVGGGMVSFQLQLGNGDGTFQAPTQLLYNATASSVVVADFNGDGQADLAYTDYNSSTLTVMLGRGDGTFQTLASQQFGPGNVSGDVSGLMTADFDGDGIPDLIANVPLASGSGYGFAVFFGNGDGTFRRSATYPVGVIAIADFNNDGRMDLVVNSSGLTPIGVMLGNGDGTFQTPFHTQAGLWTSLVIGDINGDGKLDIVVNTGPFTPIFIMMGNGDGTFATPASLSIAGDSLWIADINGDGRADILTSTQVLYGAPPAADLTIYVTHTGTLTPAQVGAQYQLTVQNVGGAAISGLVTVTDTLGYGLTATSISGTGWTCNLATLSCTRSESLAAGASYPPITLTVNLSNFAEGQTTNTAAVSGPPDAAAAAKTAADTAVIAAQSLIYSSAASGLPGSTINVPISVELVSTAALSSLAFKVSVVPAQGAPALATPLSFLSYVQSGTPSVSADTNSATITWSNLNATFASGSQYLLGYLTVTAPARSLGQSYTVQVSAVTVATTSGSFAIGQGLSSTLSVTNAYTIGDVFPATADTSPSFGDGQVNTLDLVAVLRAITGSPGSVPATCSDRFDAMDASPADTSLQRGGDGLLNTLDLIVLLRRVVNLDTSRPQRSGKPVRCSEMTAQQRTIKPSRGPVAGVLQLGAAQATPDGAWQTPVYLRANLDLNLSGLSWSAGYDVANSDGAQSDAANRLPLHFIHTGDMPSMTDEELPGKVAVAWLSGWRSKANDRVLLGYIKSSTAQPLHFYGASANAATDGATVVLAWE
jgi:uncharacterized repeat protein (TIGR01451 family)